MSRTFSITPARRLTVEVPKQATVRRPPPTFCVGCTKLKQEAFQAPVVWPARRQPSDVPDSTHPSPGSARHWQGGAADELAAFGDHIQPDCSRRR